MKNDQFLVNTEIELVEKALLIGLDKCILCNKMVFIEKICILNGNYE